MNASSAVNAPRPLALVTGASSGIGADLARELARDGHDLVLVARRETRLLELAEELGGHGVEVTVLPINLGVIDAPARLACELARRHLCDVDVLVNNAGFGDYNDFVRAEPTKLAEMIQLNVAALTALTRTLLPGMVTRGRGRVLLLSGLAALVPGPGAAVYHATKAYVLSFGKALSYELHGTGVTVTTACPGPTRTGFQAASGLEPAAAQSNLGTMLPSAVARQTYEALLAGRTVLTPGLLNKLRACWLRLIPLILALGGIKLTNRLG